MVNRVRTARPPPAAGGRPKNKLLSQLPNDDFQRVLSDLKTVPMNVKQMLHARNEPVRYVYFPNGGVASITTVMSDGAMVEIATIGREGMVGIGAFLGGDIAGTETMVQVPDTSAERMPVAAFDREIQRRGALYESVQRYSRGLLTLMMQSTACMALHPVQQRCCRWLLMTHDRVQQPEFQLSHEFLAMMLGSTRPTVTVVAGTLQKAGLIHYRHGHIRIVDREGLESASCECYATVTRKFRELGL
jgi:CRP-like cAMP-binding protein